MRKFPILTIIICLVFVVSVLTASSESTIEDSMLFKGEGTRLTLEEAINTALKGNPSVIESEMTLEQTQVSYKKSMSGIDDIKESFDRKDIPPTSMDYMKNITLPELNADYLLENAKMNLEALKTAQKTAIEQAYFSLRQTEKQCEIQKENLEVSKALYEKTKKKFDMGLVARQEVLKGELSVLNAEVSYKATLSNLSKQKMELNNALGFNIMNELILTDELTYKPFEVESIKAAINNAFASSNALKALELTYKIKALELEITGRQFPDGTYAYEEQEIKVAKALKDLEDEKKAIELKVRQYYLDVIQKQEEIKSGQKSVEVAEEMFKLSQTTYDAGLGLLTDVQSAQLSLQEKKLNLSNAIFSYNMTVMKFNDLVGTK